jgi:hypothetical protein
LRIKQRWRSVCAAGHFLIEMDGLRFLVVPDISDFRRRHVPEVNSLFSLDPTANMRGEFACGQPGLRPLGREEFGVNFVKSGRLRLLNLMSECAR